MRMGGKGGRLFIVSAPSGSGKTTLVNALIDDIGKDFSLKRVVTYSTKLPRLHEIDHVDYHFISQDEFQKRIAENFFLEWSDVYGAYYGTPRSFLKELEEGISCIVIVDRAGAVMLSSLVQDSCLIWIFPPSLEVLKKRLEQRGTESLISLEKRLCLAEREIEEEKIMPLFHYKIMNDSFKIALNEMKKIIFFYLHKPH